MSQINIQRKSKEPTAMEKRNTTIIHFVLVALIPLFLMFLMGFSFGKSGEINEEKLLEKVERLEEELKDYEEKDSIMRREFRVLSSDFSDAETFRVSFEDEMGDLKSQIKGDVDESELRDWEKEKKRIVKSFDINIEGVKARKYETEEFKEIHDMGLEWLEELFSTKDDELYALKLKKECEVGGDVTQTLEEKNEELEDKIQELKNKNQELKGELNIKDIKSENLKNKLDLKEEKKEDQGNDNDEYQAKYKNVLKKNDEVKENLTEKIAEAKSLTNELNPTLKISSFKKNKAELKDKITEIQTELNNLKTSE